MNVAGIDCGAKNVKALILEEGKIIAKSSVFSGFDQKAAAKEALDLVLKDAGLKKE
ncbi:MAG TPA: CoA activase, partial [Candidatus Aminicenantes bacterium]|nr:CoA activase [Candidatus Aminicenantes bacterium]